MVKVGLDYFMSGRNNNLFMYNPKLDFVDTEEGCEYLVISGSVFAAVSGRNPEVKIFA